LGITYVLFKNLSLGIAIAQAVHPTRAACRGSVDRQFDQ
jgi:hypothetical protein